MLCRHLRPCLLYSAEGAELTIEEHPVPRGLLESQSDALSPELQMLEEARRPGARRGARPARPYALKPAQRVAIPGSEDPRRPVNAVPRLGDAALPADPEMQVSFYLGAGPGHAGSPASPT